MPPCDTTATARTFLMSYSAQIRLAQIDYMGEELKRFDTVPYKGSLEDIPYYSVDDVPLSHACVLDVAIDFAHAQFRWRKMFHFRLQTGRIHRA